MIIGIKDITDIVQAGRERTGSNRIEELLIPLEKVYEIENKEIRDVVIKG